MNTTLTRNCKYIVTYVLCFKLITLHGLVSAPCVLTEEKHDCKQPIIVSRLPFLDYTISSLSLYQSLLFHQNLATAVKIAEPHILPMCTILMYYKMVVRLMFLSSDSVTLIC